MCVICLPTEHKGVHKNSFRNARAFQERIRIWKCWILRRGENLSIRRKTSRPGIEPGTVGGEGTRDEHHPCSPSVHVYVGVFIIHGKKLKYSMLLYNSGPDLIFNIPRNRYLLNSRPSHQILLILRAQ